MGLGLLVYILLCLGKPNINPNINPNIHPNINHPWPKTPKTPKPREHRIPVAVGHGPEHCWGAASRKPRKQQKTPFGVGVARLLEVRMWGQEVVKDFGVEGLTSVGFAATCS